MSLNIIYIVDKIEPAGSEVDKIFKDDDKTAWKSCVLIRFFIRNF